MSLAQMMKYAGGSQTRTPKRSKAKKHAFAVSDLPGT
jgi:hypothetical protein